MDLDIIDAGFCTFVLDISALGKYKLYLCKKTHLNLYYDILLLWEIYHMTNNW